MYHPFVAERIEKIGKGYEKLYHDSRVLSQDYEKFFDRLKDVGTKFKAVNNLQLELEKQPEIPKELLDERMDKLMKMADITRRQMSDFRSLIDVSKPLFDAIFDFAPVLDKATRRLAENEKDKGASATIMKNLEEKFPLLEYNYRENYNRLEKANHALDEMMKIYNKLVD